jgi:hypothetical protein
MAYLVLLGAWLTGCPGTSIRTPKTGVTLLVTSSANKLLTSALDALQQEKSVVSVDDIQSLTVTVTEISLDYAGTNPPDAEDGENEDKVQKDNENDSENNGQDETEDESDDESKIVVFEGAQDVDLLDMTLSGLSELISTDNVPSGFYTKIRIEISNPRLVLKSDPNTVITDVQLTADGHLFISKTFELPADQHSLIVLDFGGIHLVKTGSDKYVLTPQLNATVTVQDAAVSLGGQIVSVDTANDMMVIDNGGQDVEVHYDPNAIFLPTDTTTPTGTEADLTVGATVQVDGLLTPGGAVNATAVHLV